MSSRCGWSRWAPTTAASGRPPPATHRSARRASVRCRTAEQRRQSTVTVELSNLGGPWLPTPGDPVAVSDRDAVVDLETGTLYDAEAGSGTSYQVTGTADAPDPEQLLAATVPSGAAASAYLQQPELPFALATYGARITRDAKSPYERALAIERAVEHSRKLSARATSGSAFWRIEQFLFGAPDTPGARVGTSEQFATAFALLARNAGLPTRIVVGFRPGEPQDDGTMLVRGRDALAWPEVYFDRLGWVPFSPTPNDDTFSDGRPLVAPPPATDTETGDPAVPDGQESPAPSEDDSAAPSPAAGTGADRPLGTTVAAAAGVLALAFLLLMLLLRRVRTFRHLRRGAPGAWAELLDALALAGVPPDPVQPATVVADDADQRFGTRGARQVADQAERAVFGPPALCGRRPAAGGHGPRGTARRTPRGPGQRAGVAALVVVARPASAAAGLTEAAQPLRVTQRGRGCATPYSPVGITTTSAKQARSPTESG